MNTSKVQKHQIGIETKIKIKNSLALNEFTNLKGTAQ